MRVLLTGATGFVGPHVAEALARSGKSITIIPTARQSEEHPSLGSVFALDVTNENQVAEVIENYRPTHVINLAAFAAPAAANAQASETWRVHLGGVLALAKAILKHAPECWLINVGSGLVYGGSASKCLPLSEEAVLDPLDDYAATKAAADMALGALARRGLKCARLRPFNHTGSGQSTDFAVPAFAMQIARIEAGLTAPVVRVGNLDAVRDFLDVRDVATAYALVVTRSEALNSGVIMNIASGISRRMSEVLDTLVSLSPTAIRIERDPDRLHSNELASIVGDASRARALLRWSPLYDFQETLNAVLNDCRARLCTST